MFISKSCAIFLVASLIYPGVARAQSPIAVGEFSGRKYFVLNPGEIQRVGRGVLISIAWDGNTVAMGQDYYFSCDTKFISSGIGVAISSESTTTERFSSIQSSLTKDRGEFQTSSAQLEEFSESSLSPKERIKRMLPEICKSAKSERRGNLIPFFVSSRDKEGISTIASLTTGYGNRRGDVVEGWLTNHYISRRPMKSVVTGEVFRNKDGEPIFEDFVNKDKGYERERWSVNCKSKEVALVSSSAYDRHGTVDNGRSFNSTQPRYSMAVPLTLGEAVLDTLCAIY